MQINEKKPEIAKLEEPKPDEVVDFDALRAKIRKVLLGVERNSYYISLR